MSDQIAELITELQKRDAADVVHKSEMEAIKAEIKNVREDMARKSITSASSAQTNDEEALAAFMVKGFRGAENEYGYKATDYAILSGSADGGITVPTHLGDQLITRLGKVSPLLGRSTVTRNSGFQKLLLQKTKSSAATRIERGAMPLQPSDEFAGITLGRVQMFAHQAHTTEAVNGDSVLNMQQVLLNSAETALAEELAYQLVSGTATNAVENVTGVTTIPMGVLNRATEAYENRFSGSIGKTPVIKSSIEDSFGYDDVFRLAHSLNAKFDSAGAFLINPEEYTQLAMIKDADGYYILQRDVTKSHGYSLFGKDVLLDDFMPTRETAAGKPIMLYADWSKNIVNFHGNGSWVVDPYTTPGLVKYRYEEVAGAVFSDSQAIRGLVIKNDAA